LAHEKMKSKSPGIFSQEVRHQRRSRESSSPRKRLTSRDIARVPSRSRWTLRKLDHRMGRHELAPLVRNSSGSTKLLGVVPVHGKIFVTRRVVDVCAARMRHPSWVYGGKGLPTTLSTHMLPPSVSSFSLHRTSKKTIFSPKEGPPITSWFPRLCR